MGKKPGASKAKGGEKEGSSKVTNASANCETVLAGQKRPASSVSSKAPEAPTNAPEAQSQQVKKVKTNEIDDIFGKKPANDKNSKASAKDAASSSGQQQGGAAEALRAAAEGAAVVGSKDDLFGADAGKSRKRTEEGFTIYSEAELGLNKKGGGDTDLCPFDCDCCY